MIVSHTLKAGILSAFVALTPPFFPASAGEIPSQPEPGSVSIGVQPWLGYGQWYVAEAKGIFKKVGLQDVKIQNFVEQKDINAAMASGSLDTASLPTNTALSMKAAGLPIKIVALLDFSMAADAIISGPDIKTIKDLKGKKVAFEQGATSDVLLNYALQANGMTIADIEQVPMPAANAGSALIAGQVPVAVTYEPYISAAEAQDSKIKLLYTAGVNPGVISDVLVVREDILAKKPGQVLALIKAWDAALEDYKANMSVDRDIIAKGVGATVEELKTAFDGVEFYSLAQNRETLTTSFSTKTLKDVGDAAQKAGLLGKPVASADIIVSDFINAR